MGRNKKENAKLYVGLYSDEVLERTNHKRRLKGKVTNQDRINMLEALEFVDGAFIINSLQRPIIETELKAKLFEKEMRKQRIEEQEDSETKYEIGYASGAFSNLHKGQYIYNRNR